jgi:hypothetical protein
MDKQHEPDPLGLVLASLVWPFVRFSRTHLFQHWGKLPARAPGRSLLETPRVDCVPSVPHNPVPSFALLVRLDARAGEITGGDLHPWSGLLHRRQPRTGKGRECGKLQDATVDEYTEMKMVLLKRGDLSYKRKISERDRFQRSLGF